MTRGPRARRQLGALLVLLAAPTLALAGRYLPEPKWLEAVRAPQPFLPFRLGVVEFKQGTSSEWLEYMGDLRATLRGSNYFQQADAPRLRVEIERGYQHGSSNADACKETPGTLALTYRFIDGEREVTSLSVATQAPVSGSENDWNAAMAGNLQVLLLELRKSQGDAQFAAQAAGVEARIRDQLGKGSNIGCTMGSMLARGFVATVEGTVAVVAGVGEVAGAALEVAASPEFQGAMNSAMAQQQQQRAQQQAYLDNLNAQAQAQQRAQAEAARQQREAQQRAQQVAQLQAQQQGQPPQAGPATQGPAGTARPQTAAASQAEQQRAAAEQARKQREQEAQQRAQQQRVAAQQAEAERQRKAEEARLAREREAEQRRLAAERLEQEKKLAWADFYGAHQRGLRLGAKQCDGKDQPYRLVGDGPAVRMPDVIKHYSSCIKVHYEARCPGTPRGAGLRGEQNYFAGGGAGCLSAEGKMAQRLACPAESVTVETVAVTGCS